MQAKFPTPIDPHPPPALPTSKLALPEALQDKFYDAITDPGGFNHALAACVEAFDLTIMSIVVLNRETRELKILWMHGMTQEWAERYTFDYADEDMLAQHVMWAEGGRFYASNLDIPQSDAIMQTRFFREWVMPQGITYGAAAMVMHEGVWFTQVFALRTERQRPYTREEMAALDVLIPHMRRALKLRARFAEIQASRHVLAGGFDVLAIPTMLFDEHGRVFHMNRKAIELLAASPELRVEDMHLVATDSAASRRLSLEISNALQANRDEATTRDEIVLIPRRGQLPLMLMVAPVHDDAQPANVHRSALLFAFDPAAAPQLTPGRIRKLFSLTNAEAALAVALCSGQTLDSFAQERSVALSTVKTHLKNVFAKTNTNRQTELVSLILASPAYFLESKQPPPEKIP